MKTKTQLLLVASLFSQLVFSQRVCDNEPSFEVFHANDIRTIISNMALNFDDRNFDSFEVPYGQDELYFNELGFYQTLWLGGIDPGGNLKVAANFYGVVSGKTDFWPGPLLDNGVTAGTTCDNWNKLWSVRRHQIESHIADFEDDGLISNLQSAIFSWPGAGNPNFSLLNGFDLPDATQGYAPFFDRDGDGIYNPRKGDYPMPENVERIPEQIIWCVYNDEGGGAIHGESNGLPIRMEIQQTAWAFACEDNPVLNNTLFFSYKFINRALEDIDELYVGFFNDIDIRCIENDAFGSDKELNTVFAYNLTNLDTAKQCLDSSSLEDNPPVIASTVLNKELAYSLHLSSGFDLCPGIPQSPLGIYEFLTGNTGAGPLTFGGNGCDQNNPPTNLIFPDDPNDLNGWSFLNVFPDSLQDMRFLYSIKLNDLGPGEFDVVEMAVSHHSSPGLTNLENVTLMYEQVGEIRAQYNNHFLDNCEQVTCIDDCVWPGDANRDDIANHCDLLDIGLAISESGSTRPNSLNWAPHDGNPWSGDLPNGVNLKHTDCNGSGGTNQDDFEITVANYGLITPDYLQPSDIYNDGPEIYTEPVFGSSFENVEPGELITARIYILDVEDLFGLAFQVELDNRYFELVPSVDMESYFYDDEKMSFKAKSKIEGNDAILDRSICMVHKDNTIKGGILFNLFIKVRNEPNAFIPSTETTIRFKNIKAIKSDGSIIDIGATSQDVIFSDDIINLINEKINNPLLVYPNPSNGLINLKLENGILEHVQVYDAFGKIVLVEKINNSFSSINMDALPSGIYWLKAFSNGNAYFEKIIKK